MPEITPILPEGTITLNATTQTPSQLAAKLLATKPSAPAETSPKDPAPSETKTKPEDSHILKAKLLQEKLKQQLNAERKQLEEERKQLELAKANSRKWQEIADLVAQGNQIEAAKKLNLDYNQWTQQILADGQIPPAKIAEQTAGDIAKKEIQALRDEIAKQNETNSQKQYAEALATIASEVKYVVNKDDKFPLAKSSEAFDDIARYIESEYHRTGHVMPVEEALQRWEQEALTGLEELLKQDTIRTKVLKESTQPIQEEPKQAPVPQTLSQKVMAPIPSPKTLTAAERRQRAIDAFYNRLP